MMPPAPPPGPPLACPPGLLGIVGIGASAGGLEALQEFLAALGDRGPCVAIVVVPHLDPAAPSMLPELLRPLTPMAVSEALEGEVVRPGHVYVAPPRAGLTLSGGALHLSPVAPHGEARHTPIDAFLHSLAEDQGERAVGIILSGTGTDGTLGLKAVGDAGGMSIAQDSQSARFDSMPRNAATLGMADHVLPPGDMPTVVLTYLEHLQGLRQGPGPERLREEIVEALPAICEVLYRDTEHDFKHYKNSTLVRRVQRRLQVLGAPGVDAYLARLRQDRAESEALFKELLIGVTAFFRDPEAFEVLSREVLARLLEGRPAAEPLRIWVAGCATGEEAYTIAILVREHLARMEAPPGVQIFATDIDERALQVAREGSYPQGIAENLSPERLHRFFVKRDNRYQVVKEIRELCLFSLHNLISDPPFSRLDLISCRNLLIYLGPHLQKKLIPLFHYALRPGGFLFLGPSESITSHEELFRPISARHRLLQRKPTAVTQRQGPISRGEGPRSGAPAAAAGAPQEPDISLIAQRIVLDEFAPKYAVINEEGQIVCISGGTARYLEAPPGAFQNNIVKMAKPGLRVGLRAALAEASQRKRAAVHEDLSVVTESGVRPIKLTVQPMPGLGEGQGLYMVVFQDTGPALSREEAGRDSGEHVSLIEHLERELATMRADLEKTIQDLEAANEELKSSNEELLSMNEELQSANEELETSKEEIQLANEALARAHSDLENLFASTRIATLFLDQELNIQNFTPAATEVYNLIPSDIGRPLHHITHRARHMPPLPEVSALRPRGDGAAPCPLEDEIETVDGRCYMRRVLPYRTPAGRVEGMVLTFTDVTALRESQRAAQRQADELRKSEARMRLALESGGMGTWHWDARTGALYWDAFQFELYGIRAEDFVPEIEFFYRLVHPDDRERVRAKMDASLRSGEPFDMEFRILRPDGQVRWLARKGRALRDAAGNLVEMFGVNFDVTGRRLTQEELERAVRFSEMFIGVLEHDLRNPLGAIKLNAEVLGRHVSEERSAKRVARIGAAVLRIERMVDQLLDFTRARLGRGIPLAPSAADLREICQAVADELDGGGPGLVAVEARGETGGVWDRDRLAQLISNLAGNALQHRDGDAPVVLRIDGAGEGGVALSVWNQGLVPPDLLPVIFEPLQSGRPRTEGQRGLGLGLYISQQIAQAHGGWISVRSQPGEGTTFIVQLPRAAAPVESGRVFLSR